MKQVITVPKSQMRDRDPRLVDQVIGRKRQSLDASDPIDWSGCPLRKRYPVWSDFMEELAAAREEQKAGGRLAPTVCIAPAQHVHTVRTPDPAPWDDGPSVADVNRVYKTTDKGR